jgi:DNA replication protein DnaC
MSTNPEDMKAQLTDNLKELHLPTMRGSFEEQARQAQQESQSYERYLLELTERECQARREHRIERLLRESRLPPGKDLQALNLKRLPPKVVQQVRALVDGTFADRRENVLAFGNPGSGKTHVLSAISHELIRSGRRVYFQWPDSELERRSFRTYPVVLPSQSTDLTRTWRSAGCLTDGLRIRTSRSGNSTSSTAPVQPVGA